MLHDFFVVVHTMGKDFIVTFSTKTQKLCVIKTNNYIDVNSVNMVVNSDTSLVENNESLHGLFDDTFHCFLENDRTNSCIYTNIF